MEASLKPLLPTALALLALVAPPPMAAAPAEPAPPTLPAAAEAPQAGSPQAVPPLLSPGEAEERGRDLRVFLLTMDQGDEVWEKFGHNALLVRNEATGEEIAWNWGLFNFQDVDFIPRFLRGTMRYSMGGFPPDLMLQEYVRAERTVWANEVHLTPAQAGALDAFVRWNALEENRHYTYDYFRDNCSTRVRDVLDRVLDGSLEAWFGDRETPHSYRWHTRRLVQGTTWIDQGLSFLLGLRGDRARTEWEAMFIPMIMMELLEGVQVPHPDLPGETLPLLGPRQVVYQADRPPAPAGPPSFSLWSLVLGVGVGGLLAGLAWGGLRPGSRVRRWGLGVLVLGWGLFAGLLGTLLVTAWFTDHVFIQWNLNLFHLSPLSLGVALLLIPVLLVPRLGPSGVGRGALALGALVAVGSLGVALLQGVGILAQGNGEVVALALPVNLAVAWVAWRARGETTPARPGNRPAHSAG